MIERVEHYQRITTPRKRRAATGFVIYPASSKLPGSAIKTTFYLPIGVVRPEIVEEPNQRWSTSIRRQSLIVGDDASKSSDCAGGNLHDFMDTKK